MAPHEGQGGGNKGRERSHKRGSAGEVGEEGGHETMRAERGAAARRETWGRGDEPLSHMRIRQASERSA